MGDGDSVITRIKELPPVRALGRRAVVALNAREQQRGLRGKSSAGAWALQNLRLFERVPESELSTLTERVTVEAHPRRHTTVLSDTGEHVWLVISGGVKLCRVSVLGQRLVEALLGSGDIFGRVASGGQPVSYEVQMLEASRRQNPAACALDSR